MNRRSWLRTVTGAYGAGSAASRFAYASERNTNRDKTILFFDDWPLNRLDHLQRKIGNPERDEASTFIDPHLNVTWGYPSVYRNPERGAWYCLYQGWDKDRKRLYPVLAQSPDGRQWRIADLRGQGESWQRQYPNQVLPVDEFQEWSPCYYDSRATAEERIKALVVTPALEEHFQSALWTSPDGKSWRRRSGVNWQRSAPDPVTCVFWNEVRQSYVLTTRPDLNDRRISLAETKDWVHFTEPELALQSDALDTPLAETYGMPVFPYENIYVGLLWVFHVSPEVVGSSPMKFWNGKLNCQLAYSRNGWHFQRTLRDPFLPNMRPGELGAGCIQPACMLVDEEERICIYSSATEHEHGVPVADDGAIVLHTLRLDGFVYLEPDGGPGILGTRPVLWHGPGAELKINVNAKGGEVRAQLTDSRGFTLAGYSFDDCIPFGDDALRWSPRWVNDRAMVAIPERTLRIELRLVNTRLYAIRGPIEVLTGADTRRFEKYHEMPSKAAGF